MNNKKKRGVPGVLNVPEYLRRGMSNVNYGFPKNGEGVLIGEYVAIYLIPWTIPTIPEKREQHYNGSFAGVV